MMDDEIKSLRAELAKAQETIAELERVRNTLRENVFRLTAAASETRKAKEEMREARDSAHDSAVRAANLESELLRLSQALEAAEARLGRKVDTGNARRRGHLV